MNRVEIWRRYRWPIVVAVVPFVPILIVLGALCFTVLLVGHLVAWALDDLINPENR